MTQTQDSPFQPGLFAVPKAQVELAFIKATEHNKHKGLRGNLDRNSLLDCMCRLAVAFIADLSQT